MAGMGYRGQVERLLAVADLTIDGVQPWDPQIHDARFFPRVLRDGSLGLGESYMDGWWDCDRLDDMFCRLLRADVQHAGWSARVALAALKARWFNLQRPSRAFKIGRHHYDLGNDLYRHMLDRRMIYSCGYWKTARNLDAAQEAKLDLVGRKLGLQPGMRVLDIGCGWGGAARFVAERYGVHVVGITVSEQQAHLARQTCRDWPIEIRLEDYRHLDGRFDRVFSLGMFEHVGCKNYRQFMRVVRDRLAADGLFLLHTIGSDVSNFAADPWIERYIFPNSMLPSARQICTAAEGLFVLEDWHGFGPDYDPTLRAWHANFAAAWDALQDRYDTRFYRMWRYFLLACAGLFRARKAELWQIVFSCRGIPGGYRVPR